MSVVFTSGNRLTAGALVMVSIMLATLTEALAGTVLSLGRGDIIGDIHATPDEFAWLDVGYTTAKFMGFMIAPWLLSRISPRGLMLGVVSLMGITCGASVFTSQLDALIALRVLQGLSGGVLLVSGQAIIFLGYPSLWQPVLQALFAMGAVVAPATLAPAFQGWLLDAQSWTWIFFSVVPMALGAVGLLLIADGPWPPRSARRPFDWVGFSLLSVTLFCCSYVLGQGSRWDWFQEPRIVWLSIIGAVGGLIFLSQQMIIRERGLLDFALFWSQDFSFAFIVSFVAGAALFGSAYLIPSFAVLVLAFTPTDAGLLLLPSGALFVGALLIAAFLVQVRRVSPIATVPFGILTIITAMWMLSGSTTESGADDVMTAVLLRGFGLGFLFLSITLIAFGKLGNSSLASGIGLFNTGRQVGGLIGVAGLQTLIEYKVASSFSVLSSSVASGDSALTERLRSTTAMLAGKGLDSAEAGRAAMVLLNKAVVGQSTLIAFDTAFTAIALLFVIAAPMLVTVKFLFSRYGDNIPTKVAV